MTVSFVRIDDRMIHGQTVTRWAKEYPCDGLIAVNNAAAGNKVLIQAYKGASDKKTFVWTKEAFKEKSGKVTESDSRYFLITKNPVDMKEILVYLVMLRKSSLALLMTVLELLSWGITSPLPRKRQKRLRRSKKQATKSNSSFYQMFP